jgi:hypothetical protein
MVEWQFGIQEKSLNEPVKSTGSFVLTPEGTQKLAVTDSEENRITCDAKFLTLLAEWELSERECCI